MSMKEAIGKTVSYAKRNGIAAAWGAARERLHDRKVPYLFAEEGDEVLRQQRIQYAVWKKQQQAPMISILVPCYKTPPVYFREMLQSVCRQTYGNWELILADATPYGETGTVNESDQNEIAGILAEIAPDDKRIIYNHLKLNDGISENTNRALELASGEYTCLLDHDDLLTEDALYEMAQKIIARRTVESCRKPENGNLCFLYSDEDKCNGDHSRYYEPNRKPEFNADYLFSNNYICHLSMFRTDLLRSLGFRKEYDGAQDYDVILRACALALEENGRDSIVHIPKVLYHWRCHEGSTASNPESKRYAYDAGKRALENYFESRKIHASVTDLPHVGFYRTTYLPDVFTARADIGIVGGKLTDRKGRIAGGIYDEQGESLYAGLPRGYSGGFQHLAALQQDAFAVDLRCMKVRPECWELYRQLTGIPYCAGNGDPVKLPDQWDKAEIRKRSIALCRAVQERGYRILWDPQMVQKTDK